MPADNLVTNIKVFPITGNETVRANVFFEIGGMFKIKATLMENAKGYFISYPGRYFQDKEGNKKWASDVDTLNKEITQKMKDLIFSEYQKVQANGGKPAAAGSTAPAAKAPSNKIPW